MTRKSLFAVVALLAAAAMVMPAMAKPISKKINFPDAAKVGSTQLSAGVYRLLIDGDKVTIQKGKQVVAEVQGQWVERDSKATHNSILLGTGGEVKEIRFSGEKRVLVLSTP